jgi:uncharacterized protein
VSVLPGHLQALLSPEAYPHPVRTVQLIETHVSWVLLTGEFAYKIKRPVEHSFVDQRSLQRREFLCQEEVRLNRRFASELYIGVCPITVRAGEARVAGPGPIIEYAVKMRQFPRSDELDQLLEAGGIQPAEVELFGHGLAEIHRRLPVAPPPQQTDPPDKFAATVLHNLEECARVGETLGWTAELGALQAPLEKLLESSAPLRAQRRAHGYVRECHGDLHARNIVRCGTRLVAFDCLEFDPALRWIDVADEIAFLLADLGTRGYPLHAQAFLAGYLSASGDYQACALQPVFQAHRALVRSMVTALSATEVRGGGDISAERIWYAAYVDGAHRAAAPRRATLVLMCGLSGSGKTWLAQRLAPKLAAVHVRSDVERKRLAGLAVTDRSGSALGAGLYSREASARVYDRLAECASDALRGGYTTLVDATFGRAEDRARFYDLARRLGARSCLVHCHAPRQVLGTRIVERQRRHDDPSEADLALLTWQEERFEAPKPNEADELFEAESPDGAALEALIARLSALRA